MIIVVIVLFILPFIFLFWRIKLWLLKKKIPKKYKEVKDEEGNRSGNQVKGDRTFREDEDSNRKIRGGEGNNGESLISSKRNGISLPAPKTFKFHEPATF